MREGVVDLDLGAGAPRQAGADPDAEAARARADLVRIEDLYRNKVYAKARLDTAVAGELAPQERFLSAPFLIIPLRVHAQLNGLLAFCRPKDGRFGADEG